MNIEYLVCVATQFREAMESLNSDLGVTFSHFPSGACGDAVLVLGAHLKDIGLGEFNYMVGNYHGIKGDSWSSHAWLQGGQLVIDITADQFPDVDDKVIISNNSIWHSALEGRADNLADYRIYDAHTKSTLKRVHSKVLEFIKNKYITNQG